MGGRGGSGGKGGGAAKGGAAGGGAMVATPENIPEIKNFLMEHKDIPYNQQRGSWGYNAHEIVVGVVSNHAREGTGFSKDVASTVDRIGVHRATEKQMYVIARGIGESGKYKLKTVGWVPPSMNKKSGLQPGHQSDRILDILGG